MGMTETEPWIMHDTKKIYCLYDPPHLLKNIRNNFKSKGYSISASEDVESASDRAGIEESSLQLEDEFREAHQVLWQYVEEFFNTDSKLPIRMAPKLSRKHIALPGFSKMRVRLAAQVLSHSVAAGISTLCHLGTMDDEALATAEFVEMFDKLFNTFNSSSLSSSSKLQHALSPGSEHFAFMDDCLQWLRRVHPKGSRKLPCLAGWRSAIMCLKQLWDDLHTQHGIRFLMTNRLNQDCAENLFSVIRGKGGNRDNPDARCFRAALRQVMVERIMIPSSNGNCQEDVDAFLFTLKGNECLRSTMFDESPAPQDPEIPESIRSLMAVFTLPETSSLSTEEDNILVYIAGYVARKVSPKVCEGCRGQLCATFDADNPNHVFLGAKSHAGAKHGGLVVPSEALVSVCSEAEQIYRDKCEQLLNSSSVRMRLITAITKGVGIHLTEACSQSCPLLKMVVAIFVNIRLNHTLKENNCSFSESVGKKNRKLLKLQHV